MTLTHVDLQRQIDEATFDVPEDWVDFTGQHLDGIPAYILPLERKGLDRIKRRWSVATDFPKGAYPRAEWAPIPRAIRPVGAAVYDAADKLLGVGAPTRGKYARWRPPMLSPPDSLEITLRSLGKNSA